MSPTECWKAQTNIGNGLLNMFHKGAIKISLYCKYLWVSVSSSVSIFYTIEDNTLGVNHKIVAFQTDNFR